MGYTHYWERPGILPRPQFTAAAEDCRRLCAVLAIPLGDSGGQGKPTFNGCEICFNGHADSGRLISMQKTEGLIWPHTGAHGVAIIGETDAVVGGWNAGPAAAARVLGADGDGSYETFRVARIRRQCYPQEQTPVGWYADFCKTNYRPYDLCVQGCLIVLSHRMGNDFFRVASDGDSGDWNDARDAVQHVLGYGLDWGEGKLAAAPQESPPRPAT